MKFQKKNLRWEETNPRKEEKNPRIKVQIQENGFSDSCSSAFLVFFCLFSYNVYSFFLKKKYKRGRKKLKVLEKKNRKWEGEEFIGYAKRNGWIVWPFFVLFCSIINSILKRVRHPIWIQHWLSTFLMNGVIYSQLNQKEKKKFNNKKNKIIIQLSISFECNADTTLDFPCNSFLYFCRIELLLCIGQHSRCCNDFSLSFIIIIILTPSPKREV